MAVRPPDQPVIRTRCPACGLSSLFIGSDDHLVCGSLQCSDPTVINQAGRIRAGFAKGDTVESLRAELIEARPLIERFGAHLQHELSGIRTDGHNCSNPDDPCDGECVERANLSEGYVLATGWLRRHAERKDS